MKKVMMNWKKFTGGDFPKVNTFCWVICDNLLAPKLAYYKREKNVSSLEGFHIQDWKKGDGEPFYWALYRFALPSDKANIFEDIGIEEFLKRERFHKCC